MCRDSHDQLDPTRVIAVTLVHSARAGLDQRPRRVLKRAWSLFGEFVLYPGPASWTEKMQGPVRTFGQGTSVKSRMHLSSLP